jgi:hypothetical protein
MLFNLPERGRYLIRTCGNDALVPCLLVFAALA